MLSRGYSNYKSMNIIIDQSEGQGALWLGDYPAAMNHKLQKQNNIKTILTIAGGLNVKPDSDILHKVRTSCLQHFRYTQEKIHEPTKTLQIWGDTFQRIEEGLQRGSVLVHCRAGVSRSASTVIAYLMRKQNISYAQAIEFVKLKRSVVSPNIGFLKQLKQYENFMIKLQKKNEIQQGFNQTFNAEKMEQEQRENQFDLIQK